MGRPSEGDESDVVDQFNDWEDYEKWLEENDPKKKKTKQDLSEDKKDDKKKESLSSKEEKIYSQGDEPSDNDIYLDDIGQPEFEYNWRTWFTEGFSYLDV